MINEIRQHFAESKVLTENGNLTLPCLQAYGKQRLREFGFIHGHPGVGVAAYLEGVADTVLLLRNPMDHVISNYLSLLRDPAAQLHRIATGLGFRGFLYTYPRHLAFQMRSLTGGLGIHVQPDRIYDYLPDVFRYLESTLLLGIVEQIDEFIADLAILQHWPGPISVRQLNRAPEDQRLTQDSLEEVYAATARDARLGTMVAAEQAVYAKARSIAVAQRERRSLEALGQTARRVWQSACGVIVLGKNFGQREMIDGEPAWWTLEGGPSHIHVSTSMPATLYAEIRIWHAVDPTCVEVWLNERRLDAMIVRTCDHFGTLQVPLADLTRDRFTTVALRIDRKYIPSTPPSYPALLLYRFRLS